MEVLEGHGTLQVIC